MLRVVRALILSIYLQVEQTSNVASALLQDLNGFGRFQREAADLSDELRNWCQDQFDSWSREVQAAIEDKRNSIR